MERHRRYREKHREILRERSRDYRARKSSARRIAAGINRDTSAPAHLRWNGVNKDERELNGYGENDVTDVEEHGTGNPDSEDDYRCESGEDDGYGGQLARSYQEPSTDSEGASRSTVQEQRRRAVYPGRERVDGGSDSEDGDGRENEDDNESEDDDRPWRSDVPPKLWGHVNVFEKSLITICPWFCSALCGGKIKCSREQKRQLSKHKCAIRSIATSYSNKTSRDTLFKKRGLMSMLGMTLLDMLQRRRM